MTTTPVLSQSHFRCRVDFDAVDNTPTWFVAIDTNWNWPADTPFRVRFCVQETAGGNPAAAGVKLQCNKNAGAFQDVTAASTIVKGVSDSSSAEDTIINTARLGGTGTYVAGRYSNDGSPTSTADIAASGNTEWEFGVQINSADVAIGDTIQLKVVALSGTAITATTVPTITVQARVRNTYQPEFEWTAMYPGRHNPMLAFANINRGYIATGFFPRAFLRYWVGGTASWDNIALTKWAWVSGGTGGAPVPTQSELVFFDANSGVGTATFDATSGPLTANSLDFTGYTGTQVWGSGGNKDINLYGSLTFGSGMTLTLTSALQGTWRFNASGTITLNGKLLTSTTDNTKTSNIEIVSGATLTLGDSGTFGTIKPLNGTLEWNNQSPVISLFTQVGQNGLATLNLGSGTTECWNWDMSSNPSNVTINPGTSTIKMRHSVDGNGCTFDGGGKTYNNIQLRDVLIQNGVIKSSNTFNDINVDTGSTEEWDFQHGQTQTCSSFTRSSGTGYTVTINSDDNVNPHYLFDASGTNTVFNMTIKNSWANGGGTIWKAFVSNGNTDGGNNTGWDFGQGGEPIMGQGVN